MSKLEYVKHINIIRLLKCLLKISKLLGKLKKRIDNYISTKALYNFKIINEEIKSCDGISPLLKEDIYGPKGP